MVTIQSQTYTVEEFLGLDLPEGHSYELVNGIITPMAELIKQGEPKYARSYALSIEKESELQQVLSILKRFSELILNN